MKLAAIAGSPIACNYDSVAVSYLLEPSLVKFETKNIEIETKEPNEGMCMVKQSANNHIHVGISVNGKQYYELLQKLVTLK